MIKSIIRVSQPEDEGGPPIDNKHFQYGYRQFSNLRYATLATALQLARDGRDTKVSSGERGKAQNRLNKLEKAIIRAGRKKAVHGIRQFVPGRPMPKEITQPPQRWRQVEYWTPLAQDLLWDFIV